MKVINEKTLTNALSIKYHTHYGMEAFGPSKDKQLFYIRIGDLIFMLPDTYVNGERFVDYDCFNEILDKLMKDEDEFRFHSYFLDVKNTISVLAEDI